MRVGGPLFAIAAIAVAALLNGRRKPIEDAGDDSAHGDCFPHSLSGAWGLPLPRADAGRDVRNYVPALYPEAVEQDGWITVTPFHSTDKAQKGQWDHAR